jgi:flagellar hook assembly protein FlgD
LSYWANLSEKDAAFLQNTAYQTVTSIEDKKSSLITFELFQNFPNPFNTETTIQYYLSKNTRVNLKIYDIFGKEVTTLVKGNQRAGLYSVTWNGKNKNNQDVGSQIYIYKIQAGNTFIYNKMILLK